MVLQQLQAECPQIVKFSSLEFLKNETVFIVSEEEVSSIDQYGVWVLGVHKVKQLFPIIQDWLKYFCKGIPAGTMQEPYFNNLMEVGVLPDGSHQHC